MLVSNFKLHRIIQLDPTFNSLHTRAIIIHPHKIADLESHSTHWSMTQTKVLMRPDKQTEARSTRDLKVIWACVVFISEEAFTINHSKKPTLYLFVCTDHEDRCEVQVRSRVLCVCVV